MVYWKHRNREWFLSNNAVFTWCSKFWWYDSSGPPSTLFFNFQFPSHSLPHPFKFSSWERECSGNAMQWGDCQRCGFSRAAQLWNLQLVSLSSTLVNLQRCGSLQSMDVFEDDVGCKASMWSEAWWACCHQRIPSFANIQLLFAWGRPLVQCTCDR